MKRLTFLTLMIACIGVAYAQDNPFTTDVKSSYNGIKSTLTKAAEKMPEESYSFKTVPSVRSYGEMIGHIADVQLALCGIAKGEQKKGTAAGKTSKMDLENELKASFAYCDTVFDSMTDKEGATKVKMFGRDMTKLGVLNFVVVHDNEMYGNLVAFLRIKGVVPPSSEGRP
jgi:uncharacterized damage-inducible protein DinB